MIAALLFTGVCAAPGEASISESRETGAATASKAGASMIDGPRLENPAEISSSRGSLSPFDASDPGAPRQHLVDQDSSSLPLRATEQWVSIAGLYVDTSYLPTGYEGDSSGAFGIGLGAWWWWPSDLGAAIEASFFYDGHHASTFGVQGDVETWDLMLGGRFGIRTESGKLVVYGKAGALYRIDDGNGTSTKSSSGWGGYLGAGVEMRMGEHFAVAPEVMWTAADVSGDSQQFVAGLSLLMRF